MAAALAAEPTAKAMFDILTCQNRYAVLYRIDAAKRVYTHIPSDLTRTALHRLGDQLEALG